MVSMFADGQVLQPDECQSLGDRDGVIKHPPVPSGGRHCFCFGGTARIRRLFCVFFFCCLFKYTPAQEGILFTDHMESSSSLHVLTARAGLQSQ